MNKYETQIKLTILFGYVYDRISFRNNIMYEDLITEIPDFPIEGVNFKDISPLLSDQENLGLLL